MTSSESDLAEAIDMIRDSAGAFVTPGDLGRIRALRWQDAGFSREIWRGMAELGWPGLRIAGERGGVGLGARALVALAEETGRGLVPEPLIAANLAAQLLDGAALADQISGAALTLPAWQDHPGALGPSDRLHLSDGRLTAQKINVTHARGADFFLVLGTDGAFLVAADAPGVTASHQPGQDGSTLSHIRFDRVEGRFIPCDPAPALAEASLGSAAYLLGLMEAALEMTCDYLRARVQFDRKISQFQILQHMAVDLKLEIEVSRASIEAAALLLDQEGAGPAALAAISRAKARASAGALKVARDCVQLHGGIGFTEEHDIGLYLRKAMAEAPRFGGAPAHRAAFARLKPLIPEG